MNKEAIEKFAEKSLWSLNELSYMCIGLTPGAGGDEKGYARINEALEEINRACLSGTLKCIDPNDSEPSDRFYGHARFFVPRDAINWAKEKQKMFPHFPDYSEYEFAQPVCPDKPLGTKERNSLFKLVLGMAMSKYGYDPDAKLNKATGKKTGSIQSDLSGLGIAIDTGTISEYLKKAADTVEHK